MDHHQLSFVPELPFTCTGLAFDSMGFNITSACKRRLNIRSYVACSVH